MKINIISNLLGTDGFSAHTRQLANALHEIGIEVRMDCQLPQGWETQVNDAELLMLKRDYSEDMTSILIGQPQHLPFIFADNPKHTIMFLIWEGDSIPKYWLKFLLDSKLDQIWVPSEHVKAAIRNTIHSSINADRKNLKEELQSNLDEEWFIYKNIMNKIKIVPHGVDLSLFNPENCKDNGKRPFTFLCNKGWRGGMEDRGGVGHLLKAYFEEFTSEDDVRLILKLNPAYLPSNFNLANEMKKIGIEKQDNQPTMMANTTNIDFKKIPQLYKDSDVYICATRGEAFNLPGLEAHAMGLPTIQTNFGGQLDYMSKDNDWFIGFNLEEVTHDINYEGIKWATPDIKHLKEVMREAYENPKLIKVSKEIAKWSWHDSAKKAKEALKQLSI